MQARSLFLGACAAASLAGAVGGAAIDTRPIQKAGIGSEILPRAAFAFDAVASEDSALALPDHYAMDTPEGRIEAGELASRGLYAQQRFAWRPTETAAYIAEPPLEPRPEALESVAEPSPPAAPELQNPPVQPAGTVSPRSIDVGAELAAAG